MGVIMRTRSLEISEEEVITKEEIPPVVILVGETRSKPDLYIYQILSNILKVNRRYGEQ